MVKNLLKNRLKVEEFSWSIIKIWELNFGNEIDTFGNEYFITATFAIVCN